MHRVKIIFIVIFVSLILALIAYLPEVVNGKLFASKLGWFALISLWLSYSILVGVNVVDINNGLAGGILTLKSIVFSALWGIFVVGFGLLVIMLSTGANHIFFPMVILLFLIFFGISIEKKCVKGNRTRDLP